MATLDRISRSLSLRLLVPLVAVVGLVLAGFAAVSLRATQERFLDLIGTQAHHTAALIARATHDQMLSGRREEVQRAVERLAATEAIHTIRIFDPAGRITQSASKAEVGRVVERSQQPCRSCHAPGRSPAVAAKAEHDQIVWLDDRPTLRHLSIIPNEESCVASSCHAPSEVEPVLGLLDIEMSMTPLEEAIRETRWQTLSTMLGVVLFTGIVSVGLVHRLVHKPVTRLREGTRRVASGDFDVRVEVSGRHELADLAGAFNRMASEVRKAREAEVDWSRRLEERVVEKGEELQRAQRQVVQRERMASLGKLAATVAHELNNPISGLLTCSKLVRRELGEQELPDEPREKIDENLRLIEQECLRCGDIVKNLLLFARRSPSAEMGPVDVGEVVRRSLMLIRHHLEISDIELVTELPEGPEMLVGDAGQLEQALIALMVNAVEAMSDVAGDGGSLAIRVLGGPHEVVIRIGDTGVGIHPDVLPHIFEPFFSTKHEESGVGLGLAVVYGIVQRHGGTIDVRSESGRGTEFELRLPRRHDGEHDDGAERATT